ncbi:MAG TPA: FtsX-like permease family protein [Gammaproteobacteria bacterium]|nr:FtsX-like permease family protein [Gammaproteobacteria bacterium]
MPGDATAERKLEVAETLAARLEAHPRVTRAGFADLPPFTGWRSTSVLLIPEGKTGFEMRDEILGKRTQTRQMSPGYLPALGARRVAGEWPDERAGAAPAVLVSRPYADAYFPGGKAVGASMTVLGITVPHSVVTIAGVVDDIHLRNLEQPAERVVFFDPRERTKELGIRIALGAQQANVLRLVRRRGAAIIAIGIAAGVLGALGLTRYLEGMLYGVTALDAKTYIVVAGAFAAVALFASYVPARRATRIDPLAALRHD